jgi:hypothetical protein
MKGVDRNENKGMSRSACALVPDRDGRMVEQSPTNDDTGI